MSGKRKRKPKTEIMLTSLEALAGWKYFWSNTRVIRFEVGEDGEKRPVRAKTQRVMPRTDYLDFRKRRKK